MLKRPSSLNQLIAILLGMLLAASATGKTATETMPSTALLKLAGIVDFATPENRSLQVRLGYPRSKNNQQLEPCQHPDSVPLKILTRLGRINRITAAIESRRKNRQTILFTLENMELLNSRKGLFSTRLDLRNYNPGEANVWVFVESGKKVLAQVSSIDCNVSH